MVRAIEGECVMYLIGNKEVFVVSFGAIVSILDTTSLVFNFIKRLLYDDLKDKNVGLMNMLYALLNLEVPIGRAYYFANVVALLAFATGVVAFIFKILEGVHGFFPFSIFLAIIVGVLTMGVLVMLTIKRLRDLRWPGLISIMLLVPGVNLALFVYLSFIKGTGSQIR